MNHGWAEKKGWGQRKEPRKYCIRSRPRLQRQETEDHEPDILERQIEAWMGQEEKEQQKEPQKHCLRSRLRPQRQEDKGNEEAEKHEPDTSEKQT